MRCLFFCFIKFSRRDLDIAIAVIRTWERSEERRQWKFLKKQREKFKKRNGTSGIW